MITKLRMLLARRSPCRHYCKNGRTGDEKARVSIIGNSEMNSPTVSIVMPTYNRADLLPGTLESILSQSYDDFELLIVDDGSHDNTEEIIREIQKEDHRVRYLRLDENRGIGFARNAGLQHASGKYIALADSDDLWLPGKLKFQVEIMENHREIDILFSDWWDINHIKEKADRGFAKTRSGMKHIVARYVTDGLWMVESGVGTGILRSNFVQPATMVLRARVFAEVGGFENCLRGAPDHEFAWRAATAGAQYAYLDRPLLERHKYETSVSAQPVYANLWVLKALEICRQTCLRFQRPDVVGQIRAAEQRAWRSVILAYGQRSQRADAVRAFQRSLGSGFSARTLFWLVTALLGPQAIAGARRALTSEWRERLFPKQ